MLTCLAIYQQKAVQYFPVFAHADRNGSLAALSSQVHTSAANADTFNGVFSTLRPIASVWE